MYIISRRIAAILGIHLAPGRGAIYTQKWEGVVLAIQQYKTGVILSDCYVHPSHFRMYIALPTQGATWISGIAATHQPCVGDSLPLVYTKFNYETPNRHDSINKRALQLIGELSYSSESSLLEFESSPIEYEIYPIELESSLIDLESSVIHHNYVFGAFSD